MLFFANVWIPNSHLRFLQNKFDPCVQYHNIISFSNLVRFFYHANLPCKWMFLLNNVIVLPFYYMKWSTGGQTSVSLLMLTSTLCVNILFWLNTLQKIVREVSGTPIVTLLYRRYVKHIHLVLHLHVQAKFYEIPSRF